jgi:hypothetical protein
MQPDPLLKEDPKTSNQKIDSDFDFRKEGLLIIGLSNEDIGYMGSIFNEVYAKNNSSRNGLSMLNGALYALGTKQKKNPEWREHCAGSLRELIHECRGVGQISSWFCNTFKEKNTNFPSSSSHSDTYARIDGYYNYFSEVHHHNSLYILQRLQFLYGEDIKVGDDSEEMFLKVAKEFLQSMLSFFQDNIKNV